jgi:LacI family gluconate utilization system Gnt-I transcriptional repressor
LNQARRQQRQGRAVRVEDVARVAGVSPITVSRTLGAPELVRPETRERVMEAVAQTGYVVDSFASALRSGRSSIVPVFAPSLENPHYAAAVQGALDAFEGSRFRLLFAQTSHGGPIGAEAVEMIKPFRPAGVMFAGVVLDEAARAAIRTIGAPVVELWGERDGAVDMVAGVSPSLGTRLMGEHFAQQGYRRVVYCGQTLASVGALAGFEAGYGAAGGALHRIQAVEGPGTLALGMAAFDAILAAAPDCDAIFFGSDLLAVGAMIRARILGIDIPGAIAVAGYGDLDFAGVLDPPLTTLRASDHETGKLAGAQLRRRLDGEPPLDPVIQVPTQLVVRESTPKR